ncbi:hypothetical protein GC176_06485 [bacterium]|nr:hypothetical protein [bacterium]
MPDGRGSPAEFVAEVIDIRGSWRWLVQLGAGRQLVASILPSLQTKMERLAPGDFVRIRFRSGNKSPRIVGYSSIDRSGRPLGST